MMYPGLTSWAKLRRPCGTGAIKPCPSSRVWLSKCIQERGSGWPKMETILPELRYALKQLRKNPGYSLVVIVTLALSIGANTAIFSVVDALLLRPLPYPEPERLGSLMQRISGPSNVTYPINIDGETWRHLRDNSRRNGGRGQRAGGVNLEAGGRAQYVHGERVSATYFDVLGLRPLIGRSFTATEDTSGGPRAVVLSYSLWKNTFDGDSQHHRQADSAQGCSVHRHRCSAAQALIHHRTQTCGLLFARIRPKREAATISNRFSGSRTEPPGSRPTHS